MIASYISSLMMSLACAVFEVPPLGTLRGANAIARNMLWVSLAMDLGGCREGGSLRDNEPFFSTAFLNEAAPATGRPELVEESVAVLSRILSSPSWDRVLGYNFTSSAITSSWLTHVTSSLCCAASILELHPDVRSHMGSSTLGGGSAVAALAGTEPAAAPSSGSGDVLASSSSSSQWKEARRSITESLRLSSTPHSSSDALVEVLCVALGRIRDVLSGIVSSQAVVLREDGLGTDAIVVVASQNRSYSHLGMRDWECVQCELLLGLPEELWGVHPCCNTACVRLEGPCEMEVKTRACGGGCGARYCCAACQEQAWRGGHRHNCAAMREMRERFEIANDGSHSVSSGQ